MEPFIAQIMLFGGNFAPRGWAFCDGQLLAINSNTALFSLLGTIYGGDGRTSFALPDLRGRAPIGPRHGPGLSSYSLGERGGLEHVTLNQTQMPTHTHPTTNTTSADQHILLSKDAAVNQVPAEGDVPAAAQFGAGLGATKVNAFGPANNTVNGQTISGNEGLTILNSGGNLSHENRQPFNAINYIIALQGIFPSRS